MSFVSQSAELWPLTCVLFFLSDLERELRVRELQEELMRKMKEWGQRRERSRKREEEEEQGVEEKDWGGERVLC